MKHTFRWPMQKKDRDNFINNGVKIEGKTIASAFVWNN